jgi:putative ABC transport system permease protein
MRWYQRFFRRGLTEKQLEAELRFHLEQQIADYVAAGMKPEEAGRRARLEFGGLDQTKEACRDVGGTHLVETLFQDLRYGLRQLRRNPGFAAVAVLTLALGIGANTAIFSAVNAVVLHPLPYPHSDRLVWIAEFIPALKTAIASNEDYLAWRDQSRTLEQIAAYDASADFNLTGRGTPARVHGIRVSGSFFATVGAQPQFGRDFTQEEDQPNGRKAVILMHAFWQQYFGSDVHVLGEKVNLDAAPYTVVGVMPASFYLPGDSDAQVLIPLALGEFGGQLGTGPRALGFIGRLKPGISIPRAFEDLDAIRKPRSLAIQAGGHQAVRSTSRLCHSRNTWRGTCARPC